MWRVGMWYDDEKTTTISYLRNGAVVLAAFIVTGAIYLSLQHSLDAVSKRVNGTYSKGNSDEVGATPTFAPGNAVSGGPASPFIPAASRPVNAYYSAPPANLPMTPIGARPVAPPMPVIPTQYTLFTNDADRYKARLALADLRAAMKDFQDYQSKGLQKSLSIANDLSTGAVTNDNPDNGTADDSAESDRKSVLETEKRRLVADRVNGETEALNAMIDLTAHPDRFPDPLRDPVGEVSRELRTYVQDVRYAAVFPEERSRMLSLASQHLAAAESLVSTMEQAAGASSSGRNFP